MAAVQMVNVRVLDNPAPFLSPLRLEITFDCLESLAEDVEWRLLYVAGSSKAEDQLLDSVLVGPIPAGRHMFVFEADHPDPARLSEDAVGAAALILASRFRGAEFVRVGFYVNTDYVDEVLREFPPSPPNFQKLTRDVLTTKPIVTRFKVDWAQSDKKPEGRVSQNGLETEAEEEVTDFVPDAAKSVDENAIQRSLDSLSMELANLER